MRRGHTAAQFSELVERLLAEVPGIAVSGDVIVGFPGEDDRAFQKTYDLLASLPIAGMHVFRYSRRPGTDAASYPGQVSRAVKVERSKALRSLVAQKAQAFQRQFVGETLEVVVLDREGPDGLLEGLSDNYLRVWFPGEPALRGKVARVLIEQATGRGLLGSLKSRPPVAAIASTGDATFVPLEMTGTA
jgi:threonylcarbamoyladenosine tRNA methylthiotransferase MtaB